MPDATRDATFTLTYELAPSDLEHMYAANPRLKRKRKDLLAMAVPFLIFALAFTALSVAVSHPASGHGSVGAVDWLYGLAALSWFLAVIQVSRAWQLSPSAAARRAWRNPRLHGRHQDNIGPAGVTSIAPDGSESFCPWAALARLGETDDAFLLLDRDGSPRYALPKRGLPSPDLIASLREFLGHCLGQQPPGTGISEPVP